ncbi:hypothetical protein CHUAL_003879 [Chamberlinius hualienensis]
MIRSQCGLVGSACVLIMATMLFLWTQPSVVFCQSEDEFTISIDGKTRNLSSIAVDCTSNKTDNSSNVILLGFLLPRMKSDSYIVGALSWAVFHVNENKTIGDGYEMKFCRAESGKAGTSLAMRQMTMMRDKGVQVFIGPDESCMSEALLADAWDLPMISYKCSDKRVSDKTIYSTFARTMPPSSKISKFVVALLKHYEWSNIVILVGRKPSWIQTVEALEELAKENKIHVIEKYTINGDYASSLDKHKKELTDIADKSYEKTRVYVFVADNAALIDFARHLNNTGILANGEYVIISVDDETVTQSDESQYVIHSHEDKNIINEWTVEPFRAVLKLTPSPPIDPNFKNFNDAVRNLSTKHPFGVPPPPPFLIPNVHVPTYAAHLYDAVHVYAVAVSKVLEEGGDINNDTQIMSQIFNSAYKSVQGFNVQIDSCGDAEGNYTVVGMVYDSLNANRSMKKVAWFSPGDKAGDLPKYVKGDKIVDWIKGKIPKDEPPCGFDGGKCETIEWGTIVILTVLVLVAVAAVFIFRYYRYEQKLSCLLWKIDAKDIIPITCNPDNSLQKNGTTRSNSNKPYRGSFFGYLPTDIAIDYALLKHPYTEIGNYKGTIVAMKTVKKRYVDLTRNIRKELKQIRELRHDNLNTFIGAFTDHQHIGIVTNYCARGSLEDVLKNKDLRLDNMFVATLTGDLIRGMIYLHDSEIMYHGNLRSSNCLVDSRWALQIADFGLHEFKASHDRNGSQTIDRNLLWRAPELLREPLLTTLLPTQGTQKGDVYSFGLIFYHVITRKAPWEDAYESATDCERAIRDIVMRIKNPEDGGAYLRPSVNGLTCTDTAIRCMQDCWSEEPDNRPDFRTIRNSLKGLSAGLKPNIFDNMMAIMEKYALNLEGIVQERTQQLMEEKKKTETLLHRMLPKPVAESLKLRGTVEAESFDMVTIYFSDIVGFTMLSAVSTPMQVVTLLNDLYTCFDKIIGHFGVYKVETIGDAYMVVSGLPIRNGDSHAREIASMALALVNKIKNFTITHRPGERLKLRVGIHSGPCVAGVVGLKMPRYCLFGDTVNTASRMESTGEALKIHVSEACKNILDKLGGFSLQERGFIAVKGKGDMRTFWLLGKEGGNEQQCPSSLRSSQWDLMMDDSGVSTAAEDNIESLNGKCQNVVTTKLDEISHILTKSESLNRLSSHENINDRRSSPSTTDDYETTPSPTGSLPSSPLLPAKSRHYNINNNNNNNHSHKQLYLDVESGLNGGVSSSFTSKMIKKKFTKGGFVSCSNMILQPDEIREKNHQKCDKLVNGRFGLKSIDKCDSAPMITFKNETFRQQGNQI